MRTNKQELYQLFGRPLAEKGLQICAEINH